MLTSKLAALQYTSQVINFVDVQGPLLGQDVLYVSLGVIKQVEPV
jgi:hypothetical protein